jgi:hypothetical protein
LAPLLVLVESMVSLFMLFPLGVCWKKNASGAGSTAL